MRHIARNNIMSIAADSENPNFPASRLLDSHPKLKWRALDGDASAKLTAEVIGGCSDIMIAGTNAATATVKAINPNAARWASDAWGREATGLVAAANGILAASAFVADVFIYDTRNDSDGGRWRSKCQGLSWYNEQLNTATRGATRDFPEVALIVAETNKVTIYDATKADCPMWMVFNAASNAYLYRISGIYLKSVVMKEGQLVVGVEGTSGCVSAVDFPRDRSKWSGLFVSSFIRVTLPISGRNNTDTTYRESVSYAGIVSRAVTDVAITTISRAKNEIGLLDPVIAVATDGGVSVIDGPAGIGTVIDLTYVKSTDKVSTSVRFPESGGIMWTNRDGGGNGTGVYVMAESTIPDADKATAPPRIYATRATMSGASLCYSPTADFSYAKCLAEGAIGHGSGLTLLREDLASPVAGMVNLITKDFITGWMRGDIRRALICEAGWTTENLVGGTLADRCVKASSFTVNGTLSRSPVAIGAELQCLGPFSTANYLSQPYSADLDFAGDMHILGWLYMTPNSAIEVIASRGYWVGGWNGQPAWAVQILTDGKIRLAVTTNGSTWDTPASQSAVNISRFLMFGIIRRANKIEIWIDGIKETDHSMVAAIASWASANATLWIGTNQGFGNTLPHGKLALLRIGAGAPSNAQIAEIYRTELPLFQPGAKCTLQGTSNAVNALSFDPGKQLLHVGTPAGLTSFRGLSVVPTTYTEGLAVSPDIKAISSCRGRVLVGSASESYTWSPPYYSVAPDEWANKELSVSATVTQRSKSKALWLQLSETISTPCELSISLSGDAPVEAGVVTANIAETYGGRNPSWGIHEGRRDFSVKVEASNGSQYYKKRDIVRHFAFSAILSRPQAIKLENSFDDLGEIPSAWRLTDLVGNDWVVFGKFDGPPEINHANHNYSEIRAGIIEVL